MKRSFVTGVGAVALCAASSAAYAKETKYTLSGPSAANGITVTPRDGNIHDGEKLWVKLLFVNNSGKTVLLDRNRMIAKAAGGTFTRITPVTGKGEVFIVKQNEKQNLYVEFAAPQGQPVTLEIKGAFDLDMKPIELPSITMQPGG